MTVEDLEHVGLVSKSNGAADNQSTNVKEGLGKKWLIPLLAIALVVGMGVMWRQGNEPTISSHLETKTDEPKQDEDKNKSLTISNNAQPTLQELEHQQQELLHQKTTTQQPSPWPPVASTQPLPTETQTRTSVLPPPGNDNAPVTAAAPPPVFVATNAGDAVSPQSLRTRFEEARNAFLQLMKQRYGNEFFEAIFRPGGSPVEDSIVSSASFDRNGGGKDTKPSRVRFVRRLQIKILQGMLQGSGGSTSTAPDFVWATGGHSSAAGHGNLYDESYTAVMQQTAGSIFAAVGVTFSARNYAMGGTSCGPEVAWCIDSIFGEDLDVLSWDFGMTDGRKPDLMDLYCRRAALLPRHPACIAVQMNDNQRTNILKTLEFAGMTAMYMPDTLFKEVKGAIPHTNGKTQAEIDAMPEYVRYFSCDQYMEHGDPGCSKNKYNETICTKRKFRASWHPGWKWHALVGHLLAFFLVGALDEATDALTQTTVDYATLLQDLQQQDAADWTKFISQNVSDHVAPFQEGKNANVPPDMDIPLLYTGPNMCHTARLPAQIRYEGILTETATKVGFQNYYDGPSQRDADRTADESPYMLLVNGGERQQCEVLLNVDYKDFFYVHQRYGWKQLILPNDAEWKAYRQDLPAEKQPFRGLIAICFTTCNWGKCPKGNLVDEHVVDGKAEITVNDVAVTNLTAAFKTCQFLRHKDGHYFQPNADGRFAIAARAVEENAYLRFSSFILW